MQETPRAPRRLRRRERRLLRRFQLLAQLGLVVVAALLSAGVVVLMEVPRPIPETPPARVPVQVPAPRSESESLLSPVARPDLPSTLSTSVLDDGSSGLEEELRRPLGPVLPPVDKKTSSTEALSPVPQPATGVLLGFGLVGLAALARDGATRRSRSAPRRT